jgi:hypothetical protein
VWGADKEVGNEEAEQYRTAVTQKLSQREEIWCLLWNEYECESKLLEDEASNRHRST